MKVLNILSRRTLSIIALAGLIFSVGFIPSFIKKPQHDLSRTASTDEQENIDAEPPVRLRIPKINVDAAIDYVGLAEDGTVDVPTGAENAAWFDLGPRPGERGNSVIDGHSGWKNNLPAVFDNLYKLKQGDKIYVEGSKGTIITFVVRDIRSYDPKADAKEVFVPKDTKAHLNLITCAGVWSRIDKTHSDRLVVFADKE